MKEAEIVKIKDKYYIPFRKTYMKGGKAWIYGIGRTLNEAALNLQNKL